MMVHLPPGICQEKTESSQKDCSFFSAMVRLKRRRAGAGAKKKMSEGEEIFLSECIEERASIHGRRSEGALFYGK